MTQRRESILNSIIFIFLLFSALGIVAGMGKSAAAAGGPAGQASAQRPATLTEAPPRRTPDDRFKADILLIMPHPDDEQGVTAYLARAIDDQNKRVAALYCTHGESGANEVGYTGLATV